MKGQVFDEIILEWDGVEFKIPPRKVMGAIRRVEQFITFPEINDYSERGGAPLATISSAYASVLRYAGARISDEEVYEGIFGSEEGAEQVMNALNNLMYMMLPRSARNRAEQALAEGTDEDTNSEAVTGNSKGGDVVSSKKPSRRSSAKA